MTTPQADWPRFLRNKITRLTYSVEITGETSRSWVGGPEWSAHKTKYSKKDHTPATEQDYQNALWRNKHQYRISKMVDRRLPYETLKQIADLIGYKEADHA